LSQEHHFLKPKVLATDAIHPLWHARLAQTCEIVVAPDASPATIARLVGDADGLIVRNKLADDVFEHATRLRAVVRHGVGLDMIPVPAATAKRIPVANLPGSNTAAVAEYCMAAMLHLRRRVASIDARLRDDGWAVARPLADVGVELGGGVLGIVGVGAVGSRVATMAAAFGMTVLGLARRPEKLPPNVRAASKEDLFRQADVVVLACALNDSTRGLVDAEALALMKPDALLINVSRGPVIVTAAVIEALRAGRLGGAALDVHDRQPLVPADAVFDVPDLLLTPHVAGITATSLVGMSRGAVETMLAMLQGERPPNVVNPEVYS
jgi:D-3-phosphoglycerate dehydrogenase